MEFRVPLEARYADITRHPDRFDDAIRGRSCLDNEVVAKRIDGLVMNADHAPGLAVFVKTSQPRIGREIDLVAVFVVQRAIDMAGRARALGFDVRYRRQRRGDYRRAD